MPWPADQQSRNPNSGKFFSNNTWGSAVSMNLNDILMGQYEAVPKVWVWSWSFILYRFNKQLMMFVYMLNKIVSAVHVPVPLSIFRSNSKFDENSECSSFEYTRPSATIFCTRHDSDTVVTCAKYRCDWPCTFYTRVFWIFIEFRIRSKYA